ncbi:MAG TPA: LysM peptidoglycan-binding domain-containing protein [Marinobacterium sp.]|nr:LysM peptidoglycan-binding domain-containing protein [Marinobacterium sp.]
MVSNARLAITALILLVISGCQSVTQPHSSASATQEAPIRYVKRASSDAPDARVKSVLLKLEEQQENKDLWQLTRENMALPQANDNKAVAARIKWYAKHDRYLDKTIVRASDYYQYILREVLARGMPAELALLPVIESSYDPFVKSPARAAGLWQFIPSTGDHFGLKRNWWYDGRRDVIASTNAALKYLDYLHSYFDNDWLLALAAYNAGEGTVRKAIKKNKRLGKPTDFWHLDLPKETRAYVPKLLAIAEIFRNPEKHGLTLTPLADEPRFAIVETGGQLDLALAAEFAGINLDQLYKLNPGYSRWATDPEGPHRLLVPVDKASSFADRLAQIDATERMSWARYEVKPGDTLGAIANRFNTSVSSVRSTNKLDGSLIRVGQSLLIPAALVSANEYALSEDQRTEKRLNRSAPRGKTKQIHKVDSGESLWGIAQLHGTTPQQIARWNEMGVNETLGVGQQLVVYVDQPSNASQSVNTAYTVQAGDSLSRIAAANDVSINELLEWNDLEINSTLRPGQELVIANSSESS